MYLRWYVEMCIGILFGLVGQVRCDINLTFNSHISHVSKSCFYHIRALCHILPALTDNVAKMVACSLVGSRLDYSNSVLLCTSAKNLVHLHRIQFAS